jgi:BON domain-containing protein
VCAGAGLPPRREQGRWGGYPGERREYSEWGRPPVDWPGAPEEPRGLIELEDRGPLDWLADKVRRLKSKRPRGPKGYKRSDERIHEDVCERIARSGVDLDDVEVKVENGEVTLTGTVRDRVEKWRLEGLADDVFGVEEVHNYLRILRVERPAECSMAGRMEAGTKPSDVSH